jgi:N-carbamoylputrescine amidase
MARGKGTFKVGLVQMQMTSDPTENTDKADRLVREAARDGAEVVCLPELYRSPYFCQIEDAELFDLAEDKAGPSAERFQKVAREAGCAVVVPIFEKRALGLYHNSAIIIDANGARVEAVKGPMSSVAQTLAEAAGRAMGARAGAKDGNGDT